LQGVYVVASGAEPPKAKTKYKKKADESVTSLKSKTTSTSKEAEQVKLVTKRRKTDFHISQASGSGDVVDTQSKVLNEQQQKTSGTDEGTSIIPRVLDVPPYESKSDKESWGDSDDEDDDNDEDGDNDDDAESDDHDDDSDNEIIESDKDDEVLKELYGDVNVNLEKGDAEITDANPKGSEQLNVSQESRFEQEEDAHMTLTPVSDAQKVNEPVQSSSVSSDFTSKFLNLENPSSADNEVESLMETLVPHATVIPELTFGFTTTTPPPPLEEAQAENQDFLNQLDMTIKKIIKNEVKEQVSKIMPNIEKYVTESLRAKVLVRPTNQPQIAYAVAASSSKFELKKILIDKIEANKSDKMIKTRMKTSLLDQTDGQREGNLVKMLHPSKIQGIQQDQEFIMGDNIEQPVDKEIWITQAARTKEPPTSFDEFNDTSFDFFAFFLHQLQIPDLTQEILVGLAFNLLKGTFKSITKLEYHLEECSKATAERLDWHNPETKPYLFDLRKPLPLIQDHRGRQIILKDYLINKDLEYPNDGYSSRRYSTFMTTTTEEIEVRLDYHQLYTFKEGDFKRLRLQDIEDMLLLLVQQKLTNLTIDERFDLNVALRMFTRRIFIQKRVKDLQLGVKSY
nr:hypothetical protein [Tanacetum cinerariifolium]